MEKKRKNERKEEGELPSTIAPPQSTAWAKMFCFKLLGLFCFVPFCLCLLPFCLQGLPLGGGACGPCSSGSLGCSGASGPCSSGSPGEKIRKKERKKEKGRKNERKEEEGREGRERKKARRKNYINKLPIDRLSGCYWQL